MKQAHYISLTKALQIQVANDSEAPTVPARVLKILKVSGIDELSDTSSIDITYGYGYINSQNNFVLLEKSVKVETIADISDDGTGFGINPITRQREKAGDWNSRITVPPANQPNRTKGDFRLQDLYQHLMDKIGVAGTIKKEAQ